MIDLKRDAQLLGMFAAGMLAGGSMGVENRQLIAAALIFIAIVMRVMASARSKAVNGNNL